MLLRDSVIFIVSRALPGVLGFATAILLTWFLPPEAFGLYGIGMATVMMAHNVLFEWLGACVMRWYATHQNDPTFMPTVRALFVGLSLAAALVVIAASLFGLTGGHHRLACILLFGTVCYGWFEFAARIQVCRSDAMGYLYMTLLRNGLILLGGVLVAYLTRSAEATLLFNFTAMAVAGCLFSAEGDLWGRLSFDTRLTREFVVYGMPVGLTMIFSSLSTNATPIMIGFLAGHQAAGAYAASFLIVQSTLGVISSGIAAAGYPAAVRAVESENPSAATAVLTNNFTLLLALLLPAGVGLAMLSPGIADVFLSPAYRDAVTQTMPWLAACAVLMGLRATYVDHAFYLGKRTRYLIQIVGGAAAINLCVGTALIPVWREVGASIAMFCAFGTALIHASVLARRVYPMPLPVRETCCILLATALMAAILEITSAGMPGALGLAQQVLYGLVVYAATLGMLIKLLPGSAQGAAILRLSGRLRHTLSLRR